LPLLAQPDQITKKEKAMQRQLHGLFVARDGGSVNAIFNRNSFLRIYTTLSWVNTLDIN
jgi:hypothetical protein